MSARDRLQTLLDRLILLSREGKVDWVLSQSAPTSFDYVSPTGAKIVIDSRDDDGAAPFDLVVYSQEGEIVGVLRYADRQRGEQTPPRNVQLRALYEMARDRVSGAVEIIQGVLDDLPAANDDIPF